jgi:serine/threonine protein kinase
MTDQRFGLIAGRYALRDQLGHGGMGRVWLAHDEMLDRDVAIKEVAPPSPLSPEEADLLRFLIFREARAAGRINHPHVVKIFDVVQTERWPWLVMEYVPSINLQRVVHEDGPLSPIEVAKIGLSILEALMAAHDAGVLHRDVKPDNVLLADDGRVVLGDFGLASVDTDGKVTRTGQLGTPQYVAPERARHGLSSREADYWSLGATLYAAVEGRSPYGRESVLETLAALAVDDPDPMRLAGPLAPVLSGLLRRNPADRTQPEVLEEQLRKVIAGESLPPAPTPPLTLPPAPEPEPQRPRLSKTRAIVLAIVAATILAAVGFALTRGRLFTGSSPVDSPSSVSQTILKGVGLLSCDQQPARPGQVPINVPPPPNEDPLLEGW